MKKILFAAVVVAMGAGMVGCKKTDLENNNTTADNTTLGKRGGGGSTSTSYNGQSIMIDMNMSNKTFAISGTTTYGYDIPGSLGYFETTVSGPTLTTSGSATNTAAENQPATPSAPATDETKTIAWVNGLGSSTIPCTFLNGGTLTSTSYTKVVSLKGLNGNGNFNYTFTYTIQPKAGMASVSALTNWNVVGTSTTGLSIPVNARIAGLSGMTWSGGFKYSFGLTTFNGTEDVSRIENLAVQLVDATGTTAISTFPANHTIITESATAPLDFAYTANAGTSGNITGMLTSGDARTILNNDNFAGNNNGGSDGKSLQIANMGTTQVAVATSGNYKIRIVANVKGNSGAVDQQISVSEDIRVIANCNSVQ
ncbi:MAG: hypothetical protein Q8R57_07145 [Bacteroidota bacterium]|nr:hypothetical protein [Bacteroidota bacterium]